MKSASTFALGMIAVAIIGCGSRTDIDTVGAGNSTPAATTPPVIDQCPSAILAGAPKAMTGNCSTRDGRSRVAAPRAPHIRWTTQLPMLAGGSGSIELAGLVTDADGNAFLSSASTEGYGYTPTFRKFDSKGSVSWATNFAQGVNDDGPGPTPFLTASNSLLLFGGAPIVVSAVSPLSGSPSQVGAFGFEHRNVSDPAIGRDGSIYFAHEIVGNAGYLGVSRANADGTIAWTSGPLANLAGEDLSQVALGNDDEVFVAMSHGVTTGGSTTVYAFDSVTGNSMWTQALQGTRTADLRVRPDGSLVVSHYGVEIVSHGGVLYLQPSVIVLAPTGEVLYGVSVPEYDTQFQAVAVAANGDLLLSSPDDARSLTAAGGDGTVMWTQESMDVADATITNDGVAIAANTSLGHRAITAIDFSSGKVLWTVPAPNPNSCLLGMTLTSDSTVVGVQCDGTVFGASD